MKNKEFYMKILGIKNNLIKLSYNTESDELFLSGFLLINQEKSGFIAQIIHLEAEKNYNIAIAKFVFNINLNTNDIALYNGEIPAINAKIETISTKELMSIIDLQSPVLIGGLAQQKEKLIVDELFFENNLLITYTDEDDKNKLLETISEQFSIKNKKILIIDTKGNINFPAANIKLGETFKLPLNYETMNFIYDTGLEEASKETKALIQEIFLEVQNYAKTLPEKFIPFNSFKKVVDTQYERLNLTALVLLKNKLLKYHEEGLFAQVKEEFDSLINTMINEDITVFDVSSFEDNVQRELISFAISQTNYYLKDVYVFVNIDNFNSDKKLLKQIYKSVNIYPITVCNYDYKYISELKQLSKNAILFSPDKIIDDFANLTVFLNKLNAKEFVVYGKQTNYLALIGDFNYTQEDLKFKEIPPISEFTTNVQIPTAKPIEEISQEIDEQIVKDVDELYTAPSVPISQMNNQQQFIQPQEIEITETLPENENSLTEADLDLIDNNVNDLRFEETPPKIINILEDGVNNELNSEIPTSNEIDNDLSFNEEISQQEPIIINEIPPLHNSFDENTQTQLQE